jgi:hypothetical protein
VWAFVGAVVLPVVFGVAWRVRRDPDPRSRALTSPQQGALDSSAAQSLAETTSKTQAPHADVNGFSGLNHGGSSNGADNYADFDETLSVSHDEMDL